MRIRRSSGLPRGRRGGFTLAEVAVTLVIVGITLLWVLEGMNRARMTAAHTHNVKIASELALQTLGQVEAGLFWEEIDEHGISGNYAEEGYESFYWEIVLGDETFPDLEDMDPTIPHDAFVEARRREQEAEDASDDDDEDEEEAEEPYEKVKLRVTFPQTTEQKAEILFERWIPWAQVYGPSEEDLLAEASQ